MPKFKTEITIDCPNTIYCGNCIHVAKESERFTYCDLFRFVLHQAKDRPQFVKCEKCLVAIRKDA